MTRLRAYLLGNLPADSRDPSNLTDQAQRVEPLFLDEGLTDRDRMKAVLEWRRGEEHLERDAFLWLPDRSPGALRHRAASHHVSWLAHSWSRGRNDPPSPT